MDGFLRDLRHALRNLLRTPGFTAVTVLTLALGIGANSAIFSVLNAVLLRPLSYPRSDRLMYISSQFPRQGFDQFWISPPEFFEFQERARAFQSVGAFATGDANLTAPDRPRRVHVVLASADLFTTLGVGARLGRTFDEAETRPNGPMAAVLSYEVWQSAFGGQPSIVGSPVEIDGVRRTIVGIMPPRFDVADEHAEVWLPLVLNPANRRNRGSHYLYLVGRLADGQTVQTARAELDTLLGGWLQSVGGGTSAAGHGGMQMMVHAPDPRDHRLRIDPLQAQIVGNARTAILVLQGAVFFVLLIACANLANLLLARAESRHRELAIRSALGAGRATLLRQFVTEGCVLSLGGSALGLVIAFWGIRALVAAFPDSLPRSGDVALDPGVLIFTLAVALTTGTVFGLTPMLHLAPRATAHALKEGGQRTTGGGRHQLRRALVIAEVALAVSLVIGSGLLLRTVWNLSKVDGGFNRARLVTFLIDPPTATYTKAEQINGLYQRLLDRLRAMPGVRSVAAMSGLPPTRRVDANDTDIEGYKQQPGGPFENVDYYQVATAGYVETLGIPVLDGRSFTGTDRDGAPVVVINDTMARTFWPGQTAVGHRVKPSGPGTIPWFTVVGVVKDVKQGGVDKKTGTELYFNFEQLPRIVPNYGANTMNVIMRTEMAPDTLVGEIRQVVRELDSSLPVVKLRTMDDVFDESIGRPRLLASLLLVFAGLALLLAAIGSYGVLSYMVSERRREIGIRMALGADRGVVLGMILRQGLALTIVGVGVGLLVAASVNRALASLLFGVRAFDFPTVSSVVGLIATVALLACYLPARSATTVDPMIVLRDE